MATSQSTLAPHTDDLSDEELGLNQLHVDPSDSEDDIIMPNNRAMNVQHRVSVTVMSFGFKFGPPETVHKLYNLRSLPNPPNRKGKTGLQDDLRKDLFSIPDVEKRYIKFRDEIIQLLSGAEEEEPGTEIIMYPETSNHKFGVGCHSGKHRSVSFVHRLVTEEDWGIHICAQALHRDIDRSGGGKDELQKRQRDRDRKRGGGR